MKRLHNRKFPNENAQYRQARDRLLSSEIDLRKQTEELAKMRRALPLGGKLKMDYVFTQKNGKETNFSDLFNKGKDTLVVYSMMFDPKWNEPCPMCNSIVDGLNGNARQITQKVNLVIIGKAPIDKLIAYADKTGWEYLRILSSYANSYNTDYFGEQDSEQMPMLNVFIKKGKDIFHTWGSELRFVPADKNQDERLVDIIWPLWNILDLTPHGREDWYPQIP